VKPTSVLGMPAFSNGCSNLFRLVSGIQTQMRGLLLIGTDMPALSRMDGGCKCGPDEFDYRIHPSIKSENPDREY
jgi:hypothetical protein